MSYLHACVCGLVDDDTLPCLVDVMVEAEERSDAVDQHAMIRRHWWKLQQRPVKKIKLCSRQRRIQPVEMLKMHDSSPPGRPVHSGTNSTSLGSVLAT